MAPSSKLYITPVWGVIVIVPVATAQVGCATVAVGVAGRAGRGAIVIDTKTDSQPAVFFTLTRYVPDDKPGLTLEVWYDAPSSKLYVTPVVGEVTVITPVGEVQVGFTTVAVGVDGVGGWAVILAGVAADTQPLAARTRTWYKRAAKAPLWLEAWYDAPSLKL